MVPSTSTQPSLTGLLQKLLSEDWLPTPAELIQLSDLTRQGVEEVRAIWPRIPEERRYYVLHRLVAESYENLHLHLGALLRLALRDESGRVRALAIQGLWEDLGEDLVGPFAHLLLHDPEEEVRAAAAEALGALVLAGELEKFHPALAMRAEEALLQVLHNPQEPLQVRCRALESISFSGEAGVRQLIEDGYYAAEEEMQVAALVAMGRSADIRWRGTVRVELTNPSPAVRAAAARAAGELEAHTALEALIELLDDPDREVRLAAIFALGRLGGDEARVALETVLLSSDLEEVQAAEDALEEMVFYEDEEIPLFDELSVEDSDWDWSEPYEEW